MYMLQHVSDTATATTSTFAAAKIIILNCDSSQRTCCCSVGWLADAREVLRPTFVHSAAAEKPGTPEVRDNGVESSPIAALTPRWPSLLSRPISEAAGARSVLSSSTAQALTLHS